MSEVIILCNGTYPQNDIPLGILEHADKIICCDGAANHLVAKGIEPWRIIGDLDSVSEQVKARYNDRLIQINEQESNDLTKAIKFCVAEKFDKALILGATGEREDHTLGNISLLSVHSELIDLKIVTDYGTFVPVNKSTEFDSYRGQQLSVFSMTPECSICSKGLKYPLNNLKLEEWFMGSLNESLGDKFSLSFTSGKLVVFLEH